MSNDPERRLASEHMYVNTCITRKTEGLVYLSFQLFLFLPGEIQIHTTCDASTMGRNR